MNQSNNSVAFGAPGIEPRWSSSAKEGVGTAYHTSCRLWFTIGHGIVDEIYYPHVDQPNTRDLQFLITDGETLCHEEKRDLEQRPDGSFPQNSWIDGTAYWSGLQLDEVAAPILLAWRLHSQGVSLGLFDHREMMLRVAAFLVLQGPVTFQERWEGQNWEVKVV